MAKIDTQNWKPFAIGALFDVVKGTRLTKADMLRGETRFIGSSAMHNGVTAFIGNAENLHPANTITVCYNGSVGETFYQDAPFWASDDVNVLYPKFKMNSNIAIFIIPLIKKISQRYNYIDKWKQEVMVSDEIKIPVMSNGEPDWAYMDTYMSNIMQKAEISLKELHNTSCAKAYIDTSAWREFIIGDLFENIVKPPVLHTREVQEAKGGIPYVVRTKFNNGIKCRVLRTENMKPSPAGVITFGAENATFFYQKEEFVSGRDIYYIDTRSLSEYTCRFLMACLQPIARKYSYNYGLFPDLLKRETIKLPADKFENPDWKFMEEYILNMMTKVENKIDSINQLI